MVIMANITLSVPDDLHQKMKKHSEIKWSEVARKAIEKKVHDLELLDELTSKSKLTEKDVLEISNRINKSCLGHKHPDISTYARFNDQKADR
jgi:predicted CopG family antitoxin